MSRALDRLADLAAKDPAAALARLEEHRSRSRAKSRRVAVKRAPRKRQERVESLNAVAARVAIRREVIIRDRVCCSCGVTAGTELDHFWGRGREESVESCWMLCTDCHRDKTENRPTRLDWIWWFKAHCAHHGYKEQGMKCARAIAQEQGQHPENSP